MPGVLHKARDLPMRDGNLVDNFAGGGGTSSPRPSYEGWKLDGKRLTKTAQVARDLPMRDGNTLFEEESA